MQTPLASIAPHTLSAHSACTCVSDGGEEGQEGREEGQEGREEGCEEGQEEGGQESLLGIKYNFILNQFEWIFKLLILLKSMSYVRKTYTHKIINSQLLLLKHNFEIYFITRGKK